MSDRGALLAAVIANPDDDTPRLVYADWLDENMPDKTPSPARGPSARADYIRVQCKLAQRPYDEPDYPALLEREEELAEWLETHESEDVPLPGDLSRLNIFSSGAGAEEAYRRGFPEVAEHAVYSEEPEENGDPILAAMEEMFRTTTIHTLELQAMVSTGVVARIVNHPVSAGLRGLVLDYMADDEEETSALRAIASSTYMTNLHRLSINNPIASANLRRLAAARNLTFLEELDLDDLARNDVKALGAASWFRNLRSLQMWMTNKDTIKSVGELPTMPNLVALSLPTYESPTLSAFRTFAASNSFPRLGRLDADCMSLAPEHVIALARALWPLRHLNLQEATVQKHGAVALADARFAESLRVLELRECKITAGGVQALAASPKLAGLQHLDLSDNPIGPGGLLAIARSPHLRGLRSLNLSRCNSRKAPINAATVLNFLTTLNMPELRHLLLNDLPVGVRGAQMIAGRDTFANLTRLELGKCGLRETGAKAIVESPSLGNLTTLDLYGNNAGKGVMNLANPKVLPRLGSCNLMSNRLPKKLIPRLGKRRGIEI